MNKENLDTLVSILNLLVENLDYDVETYGFGYNPDTLELSSADEEDIQDCLDWIFEEVSDKIEILKANKVLIPRILNEFKEHSESETPIYDIFQKYNKDYKFYSYRDAADIINNMNLKEFPKLDIMLLDDIWVENGKCLINFEDL